MIHVRTTKMLDLLQILRTKYSIFEFTFDYSVCENQIQLLAYTKSIRASFFIWTLNPLGRVARNFGSSGPFAAIIE